MAFELEPQEPLGPGIRRVLMEEMRDAAGRLEHASEIDWTEAVHEARKSIKKSRAALRLARPSIGSLYGRANSELRDIGRSVSEVRDAQVLVSTVDQLRNTFPEHAGAESFDRVKRALDERGGSVIRRAREEQIPLQAAERMRRVTALVARGPWGEHGWEFIDARLRREYRRGRSSFEDALDDPSGETVHAWRKRVKDHWYHLRLLRQAWPPVLKRTAKMAHSLSDLLGDEHDLVVLQATLEEEADGRWTPDDARFLSELATRRRVDLLAEAVPLGRRLFAEKPGRFASRLRRYWEAARDEAAGLGDGGLAAAVGI